MLTGIYEWRLRSTGKCYVGQSGNVCQRYGSHVHEFARGASLPLYRDMIDHGIEAFDFRVLERCPKEQLDEREEWWIAQKVNAGVPLYNLTQVTREPNPQFAKDRGNRYVLPPEERTAPPSLLSRCREALKLLGELVASEEA